MHIRFLIIFFYFSTILSANEPYKLGHGIKIDNTDIFIGGYFSLESQKSSNKNISYKLDDIAIMLYKSNPKLSYMIEIEGNNLYESKPTQDDSNISKNLHIERFYLDKYYNDNLKFRVGKFNSPVGFWNNVPINVLRDTTSSPKITKLLFPRFSTGINISYSILDRFTSQNISLKTNLILQTTKDLDQLLNKKPYNNFKINSHYGVGISFFKNNTTYKLDSGFYKLQNATKKIYYILTAIRYKKDMFKFQSEVGKEFKDGLALTYIGYAQISYKLKKSHQIILRYEGYNDKKINQKDNFLIAGWTYRPIFPIAIKGEYQKHSYHDEDKFLFSVSMLF